MMVLEKLADRTGYSGRTTKRSLFGGDLNLPYADWNGQAEQSSGTQVFVNRLVREKGYTQIVNSPSRGDVLLSGPKVLSPLAVMFRESVNIAG
jgi:hypothetical protein